VEYIRQLHQELVYVEQRRVRAAQKYKKKHQSLLKSNRELKKLKATIVAKEAETEYEVDRIIGERMNGGVLENRVLWTGYEEATWEPQENLPAALVQHYRACAATNPRIASMIPVMIDGSRKPYPVRKKKWGGLN